MFTKLFELGADVNVNEGELFLQAVNYKKKDIMMFLLDRPNINKNLSKYQESILLMIEKRDWPECVNKLSL